MRKVLFTVCVLVLLATPLAVVFAGGGGEASATGDDLIEIDVAKSEHPAQPIIQDAPAHLAIAEKLNIKLNFIVMPSDDYTAKMKVWLATNQVPDLAYGGLADIRDFTDSIVPFGPMLDEHAPNLKRYFADNPDTRKLAVNNEFYFVPHQYYNRKILASYPLIRTDKLAEAGLEAPKTFDELYDVLLALKKANPDSLIWANRNGTARLLSLVAYPMGSGWGMYFDKDVEGGKWLYGPVHEEFGYVLKYLANAFKDGLLDPDFAITTADQWHEKQSSDKTVWCWENMSFAVRWNFALRDIDPKFTWSPIWTLDGLQGRRMTYYGGLAAGGYVISAKSKYPERLINLLDWMITPEGLDTVNWGIEGEHYQYKAGKSRPSRIDNYTVSGIDSVLHRDDKEVIPEVWKYYAEKTDPFRTYQSDQGVGLLDFVVLTDSGMEYPWDPPGETDEWYELTGSDVGLHAPFLAPPFTDDEANTIKEMQTNVENILTPAFDKVIIGRMTEAEYRSAVDQAIKAGALKIEEIYNAAEARL
jgi:putative aldouronate transport system substrate-binding protein